MSKSQTCVAGRQWARCHDANSPGQSWYLAGIAKFRAHTIANGGVAGMPLGATIEAGSWLFDEQDRSPFSLNWICDNLGIVAHIGTMPSQFGAPARRSNFSVKGIPRARNSRPLSCAGLNRLIGFLEKISAGLGTRQMVGQKLTRERLMEISAEFNLADSDWGELYHTIHRLSEITRTQRRSKSGPAAGLG